MLITGIKPSSKSPTKKEPAKRRAARVMVDSSDKDKARAQRIAKRGSPLNRNVSPPKQPVVAPFTEAGGKKALAKEMSVKEKCLLALDSPEDPKITGT